jgi:hypothetical protein
VNGTETGGFMGLIKVKLLLTFGCPHGGSHADSGSISGVRNDTRLTDEMGI